MYATAFDLLCHMIQAGGGLGPLRVTELLRLHARNIFPIWLQFTSSSQNQFLASAQMFLASVCSYTNSNEDLRKKFDSLKELFDSTKFHPTNVSQFL